MKNQVRVHQGFSAPGSPFVYELQARRKWQQDWTILRVYTIEQIAQADAFLLIKRGYFNKEEKAMMKGAR